MEGRTYPLSPAKIGNAAGFRLPAAFYRENAHFANASGWVQVLSEDTLLVKLEPTQLDTEVEAPEQDVILRLFLDLITKDALSNPSNLEPYTESMSQEDDELLAGVQIDE
jgi:antitoxin PrlF